MYDVIDIIYHCEAKNVLNIKSRENAVIESETGNHTAEKSNDNVLGWRVNGKNIEYFPQGLDKIFKNLMAISVWNGRIKEISQIDLKSYPNLEIIDLYENNIEHLEDELFKYNAKLKVITFSKNNIFHIYGNIFENLMDLELLSLVECSCVNVKVNTRETFAKEIIKLSVGKCHNSDYTQAIEKFEDLENEINELTFENLQPFKKKLRIFEDEVNNSTLTKSLTIQEKFKTIKNKLWSIRKPRIYNKVTKNQTITSIDEFFVNFQQTFDAFGNDLFENLSNTENDLKNGQKEDLEGLNGSIMNLQKRLTNFTAEVTNEKFKFRACDI